jgi:pyruvate dehydrogenase E1 component
LLDDLGSTSGVRELLDEHDDERLHALMTNLAGHDLEAILEAFRGADGSRPTCFIAYTIKGHRLPFAAHKDNHAGLMSVDQMRVFKESMNIADGEEWEPFAGLEMPPLELASFLAAVPFNQRVSRNHAAPLVEIPPRIAAPAAAYLSTQEGFGRLLSSISREHPGLADHIVTTSPDVTVSTNLGSWVNRRGVFALRERGELPDQARITSPQKWTVSPNGQHIELGIAENNLFILLAALGLAAPLFGARLFPIGTVYDPFINRGLDSLNYGCYQDARFIVVATPSGLALAPEGGAHQSSNTPLVGIGQPSLTAFEPAYVDELAEVLRWSFDHLQDAEGGSVYLRLSTRPLDQPQRPMTDTLSRQILEGGYWLVSPRPDAEVSIVACGPVIQEALEAHRAIVEDIPGAGLLVVTSPDRLQRGWLQARRQPGAQVGSHVDRLLSDVPRLAGLVTIIDGHAATLSWLGSVKSHRVIPLGVERFGQSGNIPDLYRAYGIDADAIVEAAARLCVAVHYGERT